MNKVNGFLYRTQQVPDYNSEKQLRDMDDTAEAEIKVPQIHFSDSSKTDMDFSYLSNY